MIGRITSTALAVVATVAVFLVARQAGVDPQVTVQMGSFESPVTRDMTIFHVLGLTIPLGLLALALAWVLEKLTPGGARMIWTVVALVVLVLSLLVPFGIGLEGSTLVWQELLHLVFGLLLIGGYALSFRTSPPSEGGTG